MLGHDRKLRKHAAMLAATARLEMDMGVGDWRDTIAQMHGLLGELRETRSEESRIIEMLEARVVSLESILHRRECEYDKLQEQFCALEQPSTST
jgi:hypothetical protein